MQEKDLIKNLKDLKQIKPNQDWAFWLKSNILQAEPKNLYSKPKIKLAVFSFIPKYQKVLIPSLMVFFFVFSFTFAQTTLPGNILYPIKTLTQNTRIHFASENTKPVVRLEVAKARMEDLGKVENHEKEISVIAKNIGKDLEIVSQEIKNINNKQVALNISKDIQERSKDLKNLADEISLEEKEREALNQSVEDSQSQVLALIIQTEEEINQCPSYLQNKLEEIGKYFTDTEGKLHEWSSDDITKCRNLLLEASNAYKANDCLTAIDKIESINQLLSIHSLDVNVETSTPEILDSPGEIF